MSSRPPHLPRAITARRSAPGTAAQAAAQQASAMSVISCTTSSRPAPPRSRAATRTIARRRNRRRPEAAPWAFTSAATSASRFARLREVAVANSPASSGYFTRKSAAADDNPRTWIATGATAGRSRMARAEPSAQTRSQAVWASIGSGAAVSARSRFMRERPRPGLRVRGRCSAVGRAGRRRALARPRRRPWSSGSRASCAS